MMHHPNMHHQPMGGPPPQHLAGQLPAHHHPPPHQMHRDNRHVPMQRVAMGPQQGGNGMGAHGQPMGGMGSMGHPHHAPPQRQPHAIRAMHHPPQHHTMPQMKPLRRPYSMSSGYPGPGGVVYPPPQPPPPAAMPDRPRNTSVSSLCRPASPKFTMPKTQSSDFGVSIAPATASAAPPAEPEGAGLGAGAGEEQEERGAAVANSKEKTPMCLVNELARYNKIKHQYRLTSETGPAHKKVFTVTLRLGENEEYTAEGSSIKRAQHAAAHAALTQTRYPAPPPRAPPHHAAAAHAHRHTGTVMPTVELNALAMKLCQPAVYTSIPAVTGAAPRFPRARAPPPPGPYRMPFFPPIGGLVYRVRVAVGGRAWLGEGPTPQAARHDAAARALAELRPPHAPPQPHQPPPPASDQEDDEADPLNSEVKSPVSLVHELALKRNLSVVFTVKSERGPPHMRVFITACGVGDMETEGEGNGKKVSKRRAAERMLDEMRRRWPPALLRPRAPAAPRRRPAPPKKKPRNLIKESGEASAAAEAEAADNPISRLAMARHAARARSPQYLVLEERGAARRREFIVRCEAPPHHATGAGPSKKAAKRRAAMNVLLAMESGVNGEEATTNGDATASSVDGDATSQIDSRRKEEDSPGAGAGAGAVAGAGAGEPRQPVPGLLLMQRSPPASNGIPNESAAEGGAAPGCADQLMYLSQLLGFTVQFSDFPKRNHGEYLSLVALSTAPPVMCHGAGASTAASHEQCARAALRALRLMGLDAPPAPPAPPPAHQSPPAGGAALSNGVAE